MFNIADFLAKILGGFGVAGLQAEVVEALTWAKTNFPDTAGQVDALVDRLRSILGPHLDPSSMEATLRGIATDLVNGTAGTDPEAWQTSV